MNRNIKAIIMLNIALVFYSQVVFANKKLTQNYISDFKNIAILEMKRTGIPASIKLAQGLLESDLGRSPLAYVANNHFGIKCGSEWTGKVYSKHDDDTDSTGTLIESCFRAYTSPEESYVAHSDFLSNPSKSSRYGFLFKLGSTDYVGWANGLKFSGYATDAGYADKLIKIIESNKLYLYDENVEVARKTYEDVAKVDPPTKINPNVTPTPESPKPTRVPKPTSQNSQNRYTTQKINELAMVYAQGGETVSDLAKKARIDVYEILEYNEGLSSPDDFLTQNEIVFLNKKKKAFYGDKNQMHKVKKGESMYEISQQYGIRLESLLAKNNLGTDAVPLEGEKISLSRNLPKSETPRHTFIEKFDSFVDLGGLK